MAGYDYYEIVEWVEYVPQVSVYRVPGRFSTSFQVVCSACGFIYESYSNYSAQDQRRRHQREH